MVVLGVRISHRAASVTLSGIRQMAEYAKGIEGIIPLNLGEPDFETPEHIRKAAKEAIDEGFTHYTEIRGNLDLREAIAEKLKRENGIDSDPATEILVTAGSQAAFYTTIQALIDPGDRVIVPDPCYSSYRECILLAGGVPVPVSLQEEDDYTMDPHLVNNKISSATKAIVIASPSNPTGAVASRENLQAIAEIAQKRDLLVISDEVYEKIVYDNNKNFSIGAFPEMDQRTVTINGFSKAYAMTGWRIGYVKGPKIIINKILEMHNHFTICTNAISQKAALAALLGPQDFLNTMLKQYDRRRRFLVKQLNEIPGVSCQMPKGAFYVFPNIKSYKKTSVDIAKYIAQRGRVLVVPGSAFGANGEGHIRLSYATSMKNIRSAVQKIKRTLEEPPK